MIGLALILLPLLAVPVPVPALAAELHTCPAPREILLIRCPGRDEITGLTMSCKQKNRIDDCAQVAQGEGK